MYTSDIFDRVPPEKRNAFRTALHDSMFLSDIYEVALEYGVPISGNEAEKLLEVIWHWRLGNRHKYHEG